MHVGMGVIFQGEGEGRTDRNVYRNELRLGDLAEPLGFESLWGVEHHFTDYTMCPDVHSDVHLAPLRGGRGARFDLGLVPRYHRPGLREASSVRGALDAGVHPRVVPGRLHASGGGRAARTGHIVAGRPGSVARPPRPRTASSSGRSSARDRLTLAGKRG